MRAVQVVRLDGPLGVDVVDVPEPTSSEGQVLVDVHAVGVSFPDLLLSAGQYQLKPDVPFTLGVDLAGTVREAPAGSGFGADDRVAGVLPYGARVIAVVSTAEKGEFARSAGADDVVLLDGFLEQVKGLTGGEGVDIVVDVVGGDVMTDSLRSLNTQGRLLVVGFAAGEIPQVRVNRLLLNNVDVRGVGWGAYAMVRPGYMREQWQELLPMMGSGAVSPAIARTYPLDEVRAAMTDMAERRTLGKSVLVLR